MTLAGWYERPAPWQVSQEMPVTGSAGLERCSSREWQERHMGLLRCAGLSESVAWACGLFEQMSNGCAWQVRQLTGPTKSDAARTAGLTSKARAKKRIDGLDPLSANPGVGQRGPDANLPENGSRDGPFRVGYSVSPMRVFGLTGNIGTGKSTVASLFAEKGVPVIDADLVARDVVAKGSEGLREIEARFPGVLASDGSLDRKALGARVFADAQERLALNAILHPRIGREVKNRLERLAPPGRELATHEAALIVENRLEHGLDGLIVVTAPIVQPLRRPPPRHGPPGGAPPPRLPG